MARFLGIALEDELARTLHIAQFETRNNQTKGDATMFKNIIIALGIAALASSSAFAATKAPKAKPVAHKIAQADEGKPAEGKAKKEKKAAKKDKKATEATEKAATEKTATEKVAPEKTPAPAKK